MWVSGVESQMIMSFSGCMGFTLAPWNARRFSLTHPCCFVCQSVVPTSVTERRSQRGRTGDSAVLADSPEVHGDQDHDDEGDRYAMQDVEPQERALADEASGEQREADVRARV